MKRQFERSDETPNFLPDSFVEFMWETLIALATLAAISVGVVSLAAHLNEVRSGNQAQAVIRSHAAANSSLPSGVAGLENPVPTRME